MLVWSRDILFALDRASLFVHESMLDVEGQAWYVKGVLQGVVGVDPGVSRECLEWRTGINPC